MFQRTVKVLLPKKKKMGVFPLSGIWPIAKTSFEKYCEIIIC